VQPPVGADQTPTACPDAGDPNLNRAGPIVVDTYVTHDIYIPFIRLQRSNGSTIGWQLYIAKSTDGATTWTRHLVATLPPQNYPGNDFPQMTIDTAGNLYYDWSQTTTSPTPSASNGGEQDVYYTYSTNQGATWAAPIPLTQEKGDSAVFPWMVAGDPGQVDLVYYKSNLGLNSNIPGVDTSGNRCDSPDTQGCIAPVWNTFFVQSQNALNPGSNFKSVQLTAQPNHVGAICTVGTNCPEGGRNLLDFITVDIDHFGAANVSWTDDQNSLRLGRVKFARQLSGNSVFRNTPLNLQGTWPQTDHGVTDRAGDVRDAFSVPNGPCPGMDVLGTSAQRNGDTLTVSLTLNGPPTAANAEACSNGDVTGGGVWGAEFWASANNTPSPDENFYVAYRDNPLDGGPQAEAGDFQNISPSLTGEEFHPRQSATFGGTCFASTPPTPCTITITTTLSTLGIKSGAGLNNLTGLSAYFFGAKGRLPGLRVPAGSSAQADAAAPFNITGTGATAH
jgi:hypothetical protein